jgi:ethanolamine ammonia-lyase small subunit
MQDDRATPATGPSEARPDPFARLRAATPARIGLGHTGPALPTAPMLALQLAHACAREAVHAALDVAALRAALALPSLVVDSAAPDRQTYLRRPDLGRRLAPAASAALGAAAGDFDLAIVIADGLSALAAQRHAAPLIAALVARLAGWRLAPAVVARQGRVAIGDEIAAALGARAVLVLIGERPGLSVADGLGAYLTWAPRAGRLDSERNCVSNIGDQGLSPDRAADKIAWLLGEAGRLGFTGVDLKDRQAEGPPQVADPPPPPALPR